MDWIQRQFRALVRLFRTEIWSSSSLANTGPTGRVHAVLRVLSITVSGLDENKAASRAAALSFSSLLGLGPLVAIATMLTGFMLTNESSDLAVNSLNRLIQFIAPQVDTKIAPLSGPARAPEVDRASLDLTAPTEPEVINVSPELVEFINGFVSSARNGVVGPLSALPLILIVLQLFTSIETALNEIWGVRRGRSWLLRIVFYWTVISLGAVLFITVTLLSAGAFVSAFAENLPFGPQISELLESLKFLIPAGLFLLLVAMLTVFYRAIPNTHVSWLPALVGAIVVGILLLANNYVAFLYVSRVLLSRALYGSLAIPIVLMFGLYIFWFFILLGGQVSYAVQNVRFRNSRAAWNTLAESMRERLSLVVLITVCRRFYACLPPPSASELSTKIGVPDQLLNECLNRLVLMRLLTPIPSPEGEPAADDRYQPARPLGRTTLGHFKNRDDDLGEDPTGPSLTHLEPILGAYNEAVSALTTSDFFRTPLDKLFELHPLELTQPQEPAPDNPGA